MSRLRGTYSEQVDFIHIDWDDPGSREVVDFFGVPRRSTYLLIKPNGEIIWRWIGPLDYDVVASYITPLLPAE